MLLFVFFSNGLTCSFDIIINAFNIVSYPFFVRIRKVGESCTSCTWVDLQISSPSQSIEYIARRPNCFRRFRYFLLLIFLSLVLLLIFSLPFLRRPIIFTLNSMSLTTSLVDIFFSIGFNVFTFLTTLTPYMQIN